MSSLKEYLAKGFDYISASPLRVAVVIIVVLVTALVLLVSLKA